MRNINTLFFLIFLWGCHHTQKNETNTTISDTTKTVSLIQSPDKLSEYQLFVSKLDTSDVETATIAAKEYVELFQTQEVNIRDKAFLIFNTHYEKLAKNINDLPLKDPLNFDADAAEKSLPASNKQRNYKNTLRRNGFEIISAEGDSYIQQDRKFITKQFYSYVSPTMKDYLERINQEMKERFADDASLTIEAKQYVNRLIWWENFIQSSSDFILLDKAKEERKYYLTFFIQGMDNTPVISYETKTLEDYYMTAYTYLQNNFPNSETNKIVSPYFKALLQNDQRKATSIINEYKKEGVILNFRQ